MYRFRIFIYCIKINIFTADYSAKYSFRYNKPSVTTSTALAKNSIAAYVAVLHMSTV